MGSWAEDVQTVGQSRGKPTRQRLAENYRVDSMKQLSKVVWSEGMHLGPHHFQVQSRFFEEIDALRDLEIVVRALRNRRAGT